MTEFNTYKILIQFVGMEFEKEVQAIDCDGAIAHVRRFFNYDQKNNFLGISVVKTS